MVSAFKRLKDLLDIAIHPNGHTFAIGSTNNTVSIWDTETGAKVNVYDGHTTPVNRTVYSSDSKFIASASKDGKIHIWNADTTELNRIINTNLERIFHLSYSPDGKTIALVSLVGDDINAFLWNAETGELKYILRHEKRKSERPVEFKHINWLVNINISADSKLVATAAASYVYLWDLATGELKKQLKLINPANLSVFFTPNPNVIAVGDTFGIITLVDTTIGLGIELLGHKDGIRSVSIASTGDTIVSRSSDGVIILWNDNQ